MLCHILKVPQNLMRGRCENYVIRPLKFAKKVMKNHSFVQHELFVRFCIRVSRSIGHDNNFFSIMYCFVASQLPLEHSVCEMSGQ